jgi:hypothetical protein
MIYILLKPVFNRLRFLHQVISKWTPTRAPNEIKRDGVASQDAGVWRDKHLQKVRHRTCITHSRVCAANKGCDVSNGHWHYCYYYYYYYYYYRYYYYCSTVLLWALCAFLVSSSYAQSVWILGRGISMSQGLYLHTEQHKHRINTHNTDIHALSGIRTHDPNVRASEDSSCFRPRGHCEGH